VTDVDQAATSYAGRLGFDCYEDPEGSGWAAQQMAGRV